MNDLTTERTDHLIRQAFAHRKWLDSHPEVSAAYSVAASMRRAARASLQADLEQIVAELERRGQVGDLMAAVRDAC